jgi:threonine/homoserine/homoserine lactone efflux protein
MTTFAALGSFILVVGLLTITPGLDTALIVRTAALRARRRAWGVVLGIQSGTLVWGVLTSAGVTAVLTASRLVFDVLRWMGAGYLIWLGVRMVWAGCRKTARPAAEENSDRPDNDFVAGWRRGALSNLLNPKMGAFYVALLPQFIPAGVAPLEFGILLSCVHVLLGTAWSAILVLTARTLATVLRRSSAQRVLDVLAGTAIAGFGVRLAASHR